MITTIDTKNSEAVAALVQGKFKALYPRAKNHNLKRLFEDTKNLFAGKHPDYLPNTLKYHDYEHTLQATVCLTYLLEGRDLAAVKPRITSRQFELAIASALLHDSGYQKTRSDTEGSGAKYTFIHVMKSCAYAASYLPRLGYNETEIEGVLRAIRCTGPVSEVAAIAFANETERILGFALSSADYLGQMAAVDYPDELDFLYREFEESYDFFHTDKKNRLFLSSQELTKRTPAFWETFVLPRLQNEYQGVYRYLERPYPGGPNLYLESVQKNIAKIKRRLARRRPQSR